MAKVVATLLAALISGTAWPALAATSHLQSYGSEPGTDGAVTRNNREADPNTYYPCGAQLSLAEKDLRNDSPHATSNDPCRVAKTREEVGQLVRYLLAGDFSDDSGEGVDVVRPSSGSDAIFEQMAPTATVFAEFTCTLPNSLITGAPLFNGRDVINTVSIAIDVEGNANINGTPVKAQGVKPSTQTQEPIAVYYKAVDVLLAVRSIPTNPGLINPTEDELEGFKAIQGFMRGALEQSVSKRRYMYVDFDAPRVLFLEVNDADQPTAVRAAECY